MNIGLTNGLQTPKAYLSVVLYVAQEEFSRARKHSLDWKIHVLQLKFFRCQEVQMTAWQDFISRTHLSLPLGLTNSVSFANSREENMVDVFNRATSPTFSLVLETFIKRKGDSSLSLHIQISLTNKHQLEKVPHILKITRWCTVYVSRTRGSWKCWIAQGMMCVCVAFA